MFKKKNAIVRTRKYGKLIRFSVIIAVVAVIAGLAAYGWQQHEDKKYPEGTEKDYSLPNAFIEFAGLINDFFAQMQENEPEDIFVPKNDDDEEDNIIVVGGDPENPVNSEPEEEVEPEIRGGIVPKGENAALYDFRTSLFVGDYFVAQAESLGYFDYGRFAHTTGLDMNTLLTKKVMKTETENMTLSDYVGTFENVDAVYVLISAESISWMDCPTFVKKYTVFIDEIIASQPEAHIYIQPILPINEEKAKKRGYSVTNEKINDINEYLYAMAEERSIWILDMAGEFAGNEGELPLEYTTNGIRLEKDTYVLWSDYIISHKAHK